jgi:(1->4)-alpha-D-glucan 1-alpha-D-glucosylmutase
MKPRSKNGGQEMVVPEATYRLQFNEGFPLSQARALVPYLHKLGVSHLYASPLFKARPHSTHGYDTCDFNQLNPELGTEADLAALVGTLRAHGMGLILDIVPNHMSTGGPENHWWWDVLARGPESPFAKCFDIDWRSPDPRLRGKVLAPVLNDRYHRVLAKHELRIEARRDTCLLRYHEDAFPINAQSLKNVKSSPEELNANPGALDALLEQQFYRLAWYGCGDSELNYRRFCNITSLPGLCMENEQVFDQVFALTRQWLQRGWLDGLRVDHVDGLRDPEQFLQRLKGIAPNAWIIVEKILGRDESLPASWPVAGTTGYDFLNRAGGLFIDPDGEKLLSDMYLLCGGSAPGYPALALGKKRLVLRTLLAAEVEHLTDLLLRIAASGRCYCDFTRGELSGVLIELAACFPVYRNYTRPETGTVGEPDAGHVYKAADEARRTRPDLPPDLFGFLGSLLLLKQPGELENEFVARFQQLSAAAMVKGVEDTAYYCFNRFVALNEVGGDPACFGPGVDEFHRFCCRQQTHWPASMLTSSTHDTKRSEDVRARLSLLSEIPRTWHDAICRWSDMNKRHRRHGWPDGNIEYLYYQTLVGAWPLSVARALAYMQKAAQEAKEYTLGNNENSEYDSALCEFVTATLADSEFVADLENFVMPLVKPACINSLAQTLLKLAAPGVPDIYQGTELWDLSLVDPDNRRPVDFSLRQELLAKAAALPAADAWAEWQSGLPKLWLIQRVLNLRARRPDLFADCACYEAMTAQGQASAHVVAFKRGESLIAVVPRLVIGLHDDWRDTALRLPPGNWRNELTGETMLREFALLSGLLDKFPVALLRREEDP